MIERIRALLPFAILIVIFISLINLGVIPGKKAIVRFLGLEKSEVVSEKRSLEYVPERLLELMPTAGPELSPAPLTISASPTPFVQATPIPTLKQNDQPPPPPLPPPTIYGEKTENLAPRYVGEINNPKRQESYLEILKNFFGSYFGDSAQ